MITTVLVHTMTVNTAPGTLFTALTTSRGLAGFWTTDSYAEPVVGSTARLGFGGASKLELQVDELEANLVRWSCRGGSPMPPRWDGTRLTWELTPLPSGPTEVRFTHDDWPEQIQKSDLGTTDSTWALVLERLKTFAESGVANPVVAVNS